MRDVSDLLSEILDQAKEAPPTKIATILAQLAAVQNTLAVRLLATGLEEKTVNREPDEDHLLTAEEAAAFLGFQADYILSLARRRDLPSVRQGRYVRFSRADLREWIQRKRQMSPTQHISYNVGHGRKRASTEPNLKSPYASRIRGPRRRCAEQRDDAEMRATLPPLAASVLGAANNK